MICYFQIGFSIKYKYDKNFLFTPVQLHLQAKFRIVIEVVVNNVNYRIFFFFSGGLIIIYLNMSSFKQTEPNNDILVQLY